MIFRLPSLCCAFLAFALMSCESTKTANLSLDSAPSPQTSASKATASKSKATESAKPEKLASTLAKTRGPVRVVRTTAYHCHEEDHIAYGNKSAYGTPLRYGKVRSAAADWSRYPVGTVFRIVGLPNYFIVDDYGSALVGKDTLDLYTRSEKEMNFWGARHVKVEFLRWGSYDKSYEILAQRLKYPHCSQMARSIVAKKPSVARSTAIASRSSKKPAAPKS